MNNYVKPEVELVEFELEQVTMQVGTGSGSGGDISNIPGA